MQTSKILNTDKHQLKSFGIGTKLETHSKYLQANKSVAIGSIKNMLVADNHKKYPKNVVGASCAYKSKVAYNKFTKSNSKSSKINLNS